MLSWFRKKKQDQTKHDMDLMSRRFTGAFCAHIVFIRMAGVKDRFVVWKDTPGIIGRHRLASKTVVNHMLQTHYNVLVLSEEVTVGYGMKTHNVIAKNWIGGVRNG
ncbi:hypothetical protein TSARBOMBA_253 [Bacillus phage TsarBomba]|uniref:Uncharacterized protein n=1 Tax=Bacillus phage TsarBomba TaxID=1690456 RepID=A0A0K2D0A1_9CAUD|nr:hypothetical protein TSARBOMBA_3 [Bacillus phage TsarBomba]YP_009207068.1 hypothetical protein TSARBOMBA_253 [Bacillus phage TsarBomba]ALA13092.1 hypothetical protein TSARBOMBA_253 [Bacillus phage TsarBomba]ALA13119.1 hypothetical protein TSARBOMBA_3 [Bacillus phage TsarBomba]